MSSISTSRCPRQCLISMLGLLPFWLAGCGAGGGGKSDATMSPAVLSPSEIDDVVAFLRTLSDSARPR